MSGIEKELRRNWGELRGKLGGIEKQLGGIEWSWGEIEREVVERNWGRIKWNWEDSMYLNKVKKNRGELCVQLGGTKKNWVGKCFA